MGVPGGASAVSIVNWIKGKQAGKKKLFTQLGDQKHSQWKCEETGSIGPTLSIKFDVTAAQQLIANEKPKRVFQGQNPVHEASLRELYKSLETRAKTDCAMPMPRWTPPSAPLMA